MGLKDKLKEKYEKSVERKEAVNKISLEKYLKKIPIMFDTAVGSGRKSIVLNDICVTNSPLEIKEYLEKEGFRYHVCENEIIYRKSYLGPLCCEGRTIRVFLVD